MNRLQDAQLDDAFEAAGYEPAIRARFVAKIRAKLQEGLALRSGTRESRPRGRSDRPRVAASGVLVMIAVVALLFWPMAPLAAQPDSGRRRRRRSRHRPLDRRHLLHRLQSNDPFDAQQLARGLPRWTRGGRRPTADRRAPRHRTRTPATACGIAAPGCRGHRNADRAVDCRRADHAHRRRQSGARVWYCRRGEPDSLPRQDRRSQGRRRHAVDARGRPGRRRRSVRHRRGRHSVPDRSRCGSSKASKRTFAPSCSR